MLPPGMQCGNEVNQLKYMILSLLVTAVMAGGFGAGSSTGDGDRVIQLVYHSDTRGYYLPCG